ncbi:hypothetical protein ACOMHN_006165 [Nucella lapillus]
MGITPNAAVTVTAVCRQNHRISRCCCCLCCMTPCCRPCHWRRCWRLPCWRYGLLLLCGATLFSSIVPGAPLARWLLSEDAERHRLLTENEQRLQRSQRFMESYRERVESERRARRTRDDSPATEVDIGVTVLTMARGRRMQGEVSYRTEYLTQSVASLLDVVNDTSLRRSYRVHICNIDDKPDQFLEAQVLEDVLPVFKRYGTPNVTVSAPSSIWEKLKTDYVYCMRQTLAGGARYVLLVEDDAVAHPDLLRVLEHVLDRVVEAPRARPVAYIKLYHPRRLLSYISLEVERLTELLALSLTLGALLTCWRRGVLHAPRGGVTHDLGTTPPCSDPWTRWLGWMVVVAVLALAVGRTNLIELRRASPQLYQVTPTPSCCIPAVLYTPRGAADFADFLSNVTCTARRSTDIRMDEFRVGPRAGGVGRGRGRGLLIQPSLFSHIGLVSSLRRKEVNPLVVQ